ncbi:hypothetical protein ANCCAN_09160 [Ancylostoma caninum]|uniref:VWFA domain-containing protein n=1 Tax=Ancylostoma caninum TaxID=29170 RepID=A0A368GME3_ANCCA|nr:hypothetical protein ANCCAN_09160 [Ancylostoma caninum]
MHECENNSLYCIQEARLDLTFTVGQRESVVRALQNISFSGGSTSSVSGARLAMQQLVSSRRSSARLVFLLFTDGQSQDYWRELIETSMHLRDLPNSVLLAITASHAFSERELQVWAGEKSKVFLSNEENNFLHAVNKEVRHCGKDEAISKIGEVEGILKKESDGSGSTADEVAESTTAVSVKLESTTGVLNEESLDDNELNESTTTDDADVDEAIFSTAVFTDFPTTAAEAVSEQKSDATTAEPATESTTTTTAQPSSTTAPPPSSTVESLKDIESTTELDSEFVGTTDIGDISNEEGSGIGFSLVDERKAQGIRTAKDLPKIEEEKGEGG